MRWEERAACAKEQFDPEIFFGTTAGDERRAKAICGVCPVRLECLSSALVDHVDFGIWGGLNERERRGLARRNPGIRDWAGFISERGFSRLVAARGA